MAQELRAFSYKTRPSPLHRLPAGGKLIFLLVISSAVFFFGLAALLPGVILILVLASIAGLRPTELLRGSRIFFISAVLVLALRSLSFTAPYFSLEGFFDGLGFSFSLLFCFASSSLFFSVSSQSQILASLSHAERRVRSIFPPLFRRLVPRRNQGPAKNEDAEPRAAFISLALSLMLGFIPRFFSLWDDMEKAYTARAGGNGIQKLRRLIPPLTEAMLEAAAETERALEARGFYSQAGPIPKNPLANSPARGGASGRF
jgi:biotin transport system permease protein